MRDERYIRYGQPSRLYAYAKQASRRDCAPQDDVYTSCGRCISDRFVSIAGAYAWLAVYRLPRTSYVQGYAEHVSSPSELPMIDLVLAVRDSETWHKANLERSAVRAVADPQLMAQV